MAAAVVLAGSAAAFYLSLQPKGDPSKVVVNGKDYPWDTLHERFTPVDFTAQGEEFRGVPLAAVVNDSGLKDPGGRTFRVTGSDGYQKDVSWGDMLGGYLVKDGKRTIFSGLTKSFWVRDVITIEVA